MPSSSGPKNSAKNSRVYALDTYDTTKGITPLGCGGFNGSNQGIKDILTGNTHTFLNGLRLSGRTFYTAFGISYPEGSYGGDAAGCHGLYLGYNVRGGTNIYGSSRSLHMWVWNNDTNAWIEGYFNGARLSGHCYDNYGGAESGWYNELNRFNADYNRIKAAFPNCTFILTGSHACQCFDSDTIATMISLGAPSSTISGWTDNSSWREFVLVGKPGLGDGNAFEWVHENYSTNSGQVAHMNLSVTPKALGTLLFDGTDDYLGLDSNIQSGFTAASYEFICRPTSLPSVGAYQQLYIQETSTWIALYNTGAPFFGIDLNNGSGWFDGNGGNSTGAKTTASLSANAWYHVFFSWNGRQVSVYLNGVLQSTVSTGNVTSLGSGNSHRNIGSRYSGGGNNWVGDIAVVNFYNSGLSADQVTQNYNQYKKRFNLS